MTKLQRLSGFQHTFTFSSQTEQFDAFYARFLESDLGKIYIAVPWDELVTAFIQYSFSFIPKTGQDVPSTSVLGSPVPTLYVLHNARYVRPL